MELSWNLDSPREYRAGDKLEVVLNLKAPEAATYYLIIALYDASMTHIPGELFGVMLTNSVAVNDPAYTSFWNLEADESLDVRCEFTFDRSDATLGLFLMKLTGAEPSFVYDEEVASLSALLKSPAPPPTLESYVAISMMVVMCGYILYEGLKE